MGKRNYTTPAHSVLSMAKKCKSLSRVLLCNSLDYSLPGSSYHGILQTRILELGWGVAGRAAGTLPSEPPGNITLRGRKTLNKKKSKHLKFTVESRRPKRLKPHRDQ